MSCSPTQMEEACELYCGMHKVNHVAGGITDDSLVACKVEAG
jgi:hypothetical protein